MITSKELVDWATKNVEIHPPWTNYRHDFKATLDYIYYVPHNTEVLRILKLPEVKDNMVKNDVDDMPSSLFPSDHVRIQVEFLVHYEEE